jgi:hypothetical protein
MFSIVDKWQEFPIKTIYIHESDQSHDLCMCEDSNGFGLIVDMEESVV